MSTPKPKPPAKGLSFTPSGHRYRLDGKPVRGVTGLIGGGTPKDALIPWAAEIAAVYALDHIEQIKNLDRDEAVRLMKWEHRNVRDSAGITGTAVHRLADQLATTGEVDVEPEFASYVEGFAAFLDDWQITAVLTERPCANRKDWWAGTFDLLATSPLLMSAEEITAGHVVQIDLKTSKGVYGETAMQTAAYSKAEFYMDSDGNEQPMPTVLRTYVAHVTPMDRDGEHARYEGRPLGTSLYPLAASPEDIETHYAMFLASAYTAKTAKIRDGYGRTPLTIPTTTLEQKAS